MGKVSGTAVLEVALGVALGGLVVAALFGMFSGWLAKHGAAITGEHPAVLTK